MKDDHTATTNRAARKEQTMLDKLPDLQRACREGAHANGWHTYFPITDQNRPGPDVPVAHLIAAQCALIHTEVAEATQAVRTPREDGTIDTDSIGGELADIIMRTLDLAETLGVDTAHRIRQKLAANRNRGNRHGGKLL